MSLQIIGICGQKRHGKDSVAHILRESGYTPIAFADPIKRIAADVYGLTYEQCFGSQQSKESIDPRWGRSPRHIFQRIGTEMGRSIHSETWIRYCMNAIQDASLGGGPLLHLPGRGWEHVSAFEQAGMDRKKWVVTDIRFPNEANAVRRAGGKVIKVVRPSLDGAQKDDHASETSLSGIEVDHLVLNSGTLEDLASTVRLLAQQLG